MAAPLAFLALALVGVYAVSSALDERAAAPPAATGPAETAPAGNRPAAKPKPKPKPAANRNRQRSEGRFYRIETGDTLEEIATENGTTVEQLMTLNPGIDPVALRVGQRIRVG